MCLSLKNITRRYSVTEKNLIRRHSVAEKRILQEGILLQMKHSSMINLEKNPNEMLSTLPHDS